ncbi:IRK-interacting protein-like [Chenopodium quinoa]|uniref:IRK-interacting protein-like n=1 Tax=Chenopodium quinoa TaxID=63459 RepID=UPI000B78869E|nr:IRK-interacting protein-like [Chenopodium quinoa]
MAPPSSSSVSPSLPSRSHLFTPIQEGNESEETEERHRFGSVTTPSNNSTIGTSSAGTDTVYHHNPTPLHEPGKKPAGKNRKTSGNSNSATYSDRAVSCNNCRPTTREKTSVVVVPVDNHLNKHQHSLSSSATPSPNGLFKSLIAGISRRSPKPSSSPAPETSSAAEREEHWKIAVAELSHKLVQATRRRDEAILEASKLKYSMAELEMKLNRLEIYCHNLKSGLEICNQTQNQAQSPARFSSPGSSWNFPSNYNNHDLIIKNFLVAVSDARSSIRFLSKSLSSQLKLMGVKVFERLSTILRSYDFKLSSSSSNSNQYRSLQFYLEALLSASFYEDFECSGFGKSSTDRILNPIDRCEANYSAYNGLKELAWEEVLNKGTKHFSEEFSRFCDRKMSEIVNMLGWNRAWPEPLLQAFFGASKSVWLVHLLANSVHPPLMIFRVEKGARFDLVYMEDMGGDKAKKLIPTMVRIMVAPGFYVNDNVVKCKVISRYYNSNYSVFNGNGM